MMSNQQKSSKPAFPSQCEECLFCLPESLVASAEATDYLFHYFGSDCFAHWQQNRAEKTAA